MELGIVELTNLGIGTASILAIVLITQNFLKHLKYKDGIHREAMDKREDAFRDLEKEVRNNILGQLGKNTSMLHRVDDKFVK
jgi:hypothetical protein